MGKKSNKYIGKDSNNNIYAIITDYDENMIPDDDKTKSLLIKWLLDQSDITPEQLADYLGCKLQSLRNKLFRNSFSIDDLVIAAYACNCSIILKNNSNGKEHLIDIVDFFRPLDDDVLFRISEIEKRKKEAKRQEYLKLKASLKQMQEQYGFDD